MAANGPFELAKIAHAQGVELHPQPRRHVLHLLQGRSANRHVRVQQHRHVRERRHHLFEQLQPLSGQLGNVRGEPRDVPVRPRDVGNQSRPHRIPTCEDNRDALRGLAGGSGRGHIPCDDERHLEPDQLGREGGEPLRLPLGPALLQDDSLALHIAEGVQLVPEGVAIPRLSRQRESRQDPDPRDGW
jgi:hypothetical protein